jgi:hypothetical protein
MALRRKRLVTVLIHAESAGGCLNARKLLVVRILLRMLQVLRMVLRML